LEDRFAFQPQAESGIRLGTHSNDAVKSMETQNFAHNNLTWEAEAVKL